MRKIAMLIVAVLVVSSCSTEKKERRKPEPTDQVKVDRLKAAYQDMLDAAIVSRDRETGWLDAEGCDAMIWSGRYASAPGVTGVDIEAAERVDQPGRFNRRPGDPCWNEQDGDVGSKSTWSRDMAVCGLLPWAWRTGNLAALQRHATFGKANNWQMGQPIADGRVLYTPSMVGLLYQTIFGLGGDDNVNRIWPSTYGAGLTDYQAHLQVCSIWLRGEIAHKLESPGDMPAPGPDDGAALLSISGTMFARLEEHHKREPGDPFYAYAYGLYNGDMAPALDACLAGTVGGYVRCSVQAECDLAHRIFACGLVLEHLGEL